ncbi:hypothetical protein LBX01_03955 [Altererythrobacter sp. N1]|nr:hypothetical protein LBX01_03955 [Altererythrobacter sp. N1]
MSEPLRLRSYEDWKHCITQLCRIPLTPDYVEARIIALNDRRDYGTQRFVETWGEAHLDRVKSWFLRARDEVNAGGDA